MAQVVLSQLVEAEAQLAEQETIVSAQLADLREKIKGLQTVMAMFEESSDEVNIEVPVAAPAEPEPEPEPKPEPKAESAPTTKRRGRPRKAAAPKAATKTTTTRKKSAAAKATAEKAPSAGRRVKAAKWQRYIRDEFASTP